MAWSPRRRVLSAIQQKENTQVRALGKLSQKVSYLATFAINWSFEESTHDAVDLQEVSRRR